MHYYIDGYNMLFRYALAKRDFQTERENLINELNQKITLLNWDVSIVFDGTFRQGGRSKAHLEMLEILYSAQGETADEYIVDAISQSPHPQREIVVTNDKILASHVRHFSAKVESVDLFMQHLNRSYYKKLNHPVKPKLLPPKPPASTSITPKPAIALVIPPPQFKVEHEREIDYYQRIFETEYQILNEQHEKQRLAKKPAKKIKKAKKPHNLFYEAPYKPAKEVTEMERWRKAFENRSAIPFNSD